MHQASQKLRPRQLGPYEITEKLGDRDYWLKLLVALKIHDIFHIDRLAPWGGSKVNGELSPPPTPVEIDHKEEFEVKDVVVSTDAYQFFIIFRCSERPRRGLIYPARC